MSPVDSESRDPKAAGLSIVIPTYNRHDLLRACLKTVTAYCPPCTEIVIVDDAGPAEVADVVAAFPGVRHWRLRKRSGFCAAANAGIAATSAPIVELLNDDTEVSPGWADAALANFDDPKVAAVAPLVLCPNGRIDSAGDYYDRGGFAQKIGHGQWPGEIDLQRRAVGGASGSSAFYRRSFLEKVGHFAEQFGAYFEDVDLSCRLRRAGGTIVFEPDSRVVHLGGGSHCPASRRLIEQQSRNEEWLYWRNADSWPCTFPRHLTVLAGKALRRWSEGTLLPWTMGRVKAWAKLGRSRVDNRRAASLS